MDKSHTALAFGSDEFPFNADDIKAGAPIYFAPPHNLDLEVKKYLEVARRLSDTSTDRFGEALPELEFINAVGPVSLLNSLDAATKAFERSGREAIQKIAKEQDRLWLLTLFIILAELLLIYFPINRLIQNQVARLRTSEGLFRAIYDATPIILHSVDNDGIIRRVSQYWLRHLGYERDEVIGKHLFEFLTESSAQLAREKYVPIFMRDGRVADIPYEVRKKDGTIIDVLLSAEARFDDSGQMTDSFAAIVDVTKQKALQAALVKSSGALEEFHREASRPGLTFAERIRNALQFGNTFFGTTLGIVSHINREDYLIQYVSGSGSPPAEGTILHIRDSYCENVLSNNDPVAFADMRTSDFFNHPCYAAFGLNTYIGIRLIVNGEKFGTLNFSAVDARLEPFDDTDLAFMRMMGQWVSTTIEQDIADEELRHARVAAEVANETKSAFLANMSHEIRTPLNAVIGLTDLVLKTELADKQRDYLQRVSASGKSLLGLINDILDFSKIEAGKIQLETVDFRLGDILQNLAPIILPRREHKDLEIIIDVDPQMPTAFKGDPLRISQVLINLASNAVKFTETGEIIIRAQLLELKDSKADILFSVADTGIGMTKAQCEKLFAPFVQADISTTRSYGGTGLGLSISKQLVETMGGKIWVESKERVGSTFNFTIPLETSAGSDIGKRSINIDPGSIKVLIVDDNDAARDILYEAVKGMGFTADVANSGTEAVTKFRQAAEMNEPFGLVLLDWQMPGMDGIATAEAITKVDGGTSLPKILMVSAYDMDEIRADTQRLNVAGLISKPINTSSLFDQLATILQDDQKSDDQYLSSVATSNTGMIAIKKNVRLLLAEDNELNQMVARGILEDAGFILEIASNGREALDMLLRSDPSYYNAVLMDVQMPEMDGLTATKKLRSERRFAKLPILAMTAHALDEEKKRCEEAGMDDHIAKPIDSRDLISKLNKWIGGNERPAAAPQEVKTPPTSFDIDAVSARLMMPPATLKPMIEKFIETYAEAGSKMTLMITAEDMDDAAEFAHSIKGVSATLGATSVSDAAAALEIALKTGNGDIDNLNRAFAAALQGTIPEMQSAIE